MECELKSMKQKGINVYVAELRNVLLFTTVAVLKHRGTRLPFALIQIIAVISNHTNVDISRNIEFSDYIHRPGAPEDGNRSSFRNVVFPLVCFLIPGRWIQSENSIFLKVIHHRQNPIVTKCWYVSCLSFDKHVRVSWLIWGLINDTCSAAWVI
jgi:hypothetical protein